MFRACGDNRLVDTAGEQIIMFDKNSTTIGLLLFAVNLLIFLIGFYFTSNSHLSRFQRNEGLLVFGGLMIVMSLIVLRADRRRKG